MEKRAAEIINNIVYLTIASVTPKGDAWNTPVYGFYDQELNLYWISDKNSQHSQNVRNHPVVSIVIYDSTVPEGEGEGVYMLAEVEELHDEVEVVNRKQKPETKTIRGNEILCVYKAKLTKAWMNDVELKDGKYVRDTREYLELATIQDQLIG